MRDTGYALLESYCDQLVVNTWRDTDLIPITYSLGGNAGYAGDDMTAAEIIVAESVDQFSWGLRWRWRSLWHWIAKMTETLSFGNRVFLKLAHCRLTGKLS